MIIFRYIRVINSLIVDGFVLTGCDAKLIAKNMAKIFKLRFFNVFNARISKFCFSFLQFFSSPNNKRSKNECQSKGCEECRQKCHNYYKLIRIIEHLIWITTNCLIIS